MDSTQVSSTSTQVLEFKNTIDKINNDILKLNQELKDYKQKSPGGLKLMGFDVPQPVRLPSEIGIDYRTNPAFLHIMDYFGLKWEDYPLVARKIIRIADWATKEANSNDVKDVLKKVHDATKSLPSPGMSEQPYAALYRHLSLQDMGIEKTKEVE